MRSTLIAITALTAVLSFAAIDAHAAGRSVRRGAASTADGGVAAGKVVGYRTPDGGAGVRGHAVATDGSGNATAVSGAVGRTANGGTYGRAGKTIVNADGSVSHRSGAAAQGPAGSARTSGSFTRNADGSYSGQRTTGAQAANGASYAGSTTYANGSGTHTTSATAKNGDTYSGETSWTRGEGATHSGTCKDPSGNVIACPGR